MPGYITSSIIDFVAFSLYKLYFFTYIKISSVSANDRDECLCFKYFANEASIGRCEGFANGICGIRNPVGPITR
jgi:hypothetical protein